MGSGVEVLKKSISTFVGGALPLGDDVGKVINQFKMPRYRNVQ